MMNPEVKQWFDFSVLDLGVAEHLYETYHPCPYEIICYHCQQAAEKAIKAVILFSDLKGGLPRSHDLSFLLNQIRNRYSVSERILDYADELSQYGVATRYPNELFLEQHHAKEALYMAKEVLAWCREQVEMTSSEEEDGVTPYETKI